MTLSLKITLLDSSRYFTNSNYVNGFVSLSADTEVTIDSITVQLIGFSRVNTSIMERAEVNHFLQIENRLDSFNHQQPQSSRRLPISKTLEKPFSLQFPDCLTHDNIQQLRRGFLKIEPSFNVFMLPPSFDFASATDSSFASIKYEVVAKVKYTLANSTQSSSSGLTFTSKLTPFLFGDISKAKTATKCHKILFSPKNDFVKYSVRYMSTGNQLLFPNHSTAFACTKIKKVIAENSTNAKSFALFPKFVKNGRNPASCTELLHVGMQIKYKPTWETTIPTFQGSTARIIQSEISLGNFIDVEFVLPESAFWGANASLAFSPASNNAYISFTYLRVELITEVHFKGQSVMKVQGTQVFHNGAISHQAYLSQFAKHENDATLNFQNKNETSTQNRAELLNPVYKYKMPTELFDFSIPGDCLPSFVSANIKRNYSLRIVLECQLPSEMKERVRIKVDSKIILLNYENFNERFYENVDPLPLYTLG